MQSRTFRIIFTAYVFITAATLASIPLEASQLQFARSSGPVQIASTYSTALVNETGVPSKIECLSLCKARSCAAASMPDSGAGLCQLLVVNDESNASLPAETHVDRLLGSAAGTGVWKAGDFDAQLAAKAWKEPLPNIVLNFAATGTGRTGSVQQALISRSGCYRVLALGARGGTSGGGFSGGHGAQIVGKFNLTNGTLLNVVVGQGGGSPTPPTNRGGGGGGGSFVYRNSDLYLLVAAGGGGGGSWSGITGTSGQAGTNGTSANGGSASVAGIGGTNGQSGANSATSAPSDSNPGGSGAGWLGVPTQTRLGNRHGDQGASRSGGWSGGIGGDNVGSGGGAEGGFGGGGGAGAYEAPTASPPFYKSGCAGAGGGYSGGASGLSAAQGGGGGGSFCSGVDCAATTGGNTAGSNGGVVITLLALSGCG